MKWIWPLFFLLAACAGSMENKLDAVRAAYDNADFMAAADTADIKKQDNLELLITADALFHANEFAKSDAAYEEFNARNIDLTGFDAGREAGAALGGNMANSYRPYMMDSLFVSYYQIWDALANAQRDTAQVVINQSYDRQQNMSREYASLIKETQAAASENAELAGKLHEENSQWHAFKDIMNPALTYLSGIYFLNVGKMNDAKTYLKRANGMMPNNKFIRDDLNAANAGKIPDGVAWVFIESSFAPKLTEERIDMPWLAGDSFAIVSVAVSRPVPFTPGMRIDGAQKLADVDAMFMTEYNEYRVNDAMRAWTAAVAKAALQASLYNSGGDYAGLLGLIGTAYSMASTSAEVRTWATLPKDIYLLRAKKNKSGLIELKSGGNLIAAINVSRSGNDLIYIRLARDAYDAKTIKIK